VMGPFIGVVQRRNGQALKRIEGGE
jgi:hypothetical protein